MKYIGSVLTTYALEQIGVRKTFGIPGPDNYALYHALTKSVHIEPIIVSNELSAACMADAVSRTSNTIGTLVVVAGAGVAHAMSAIAQASVDGIPMLIISGSNRKKGKQYPMHHFDLNKSMEGFVKKAYFVNNAGEIIKTVYQAYDTAMEGTPGPVFIELPLEIQNQESESDFKPYQKPGKRSSEENLKSSSSAIQLFAENETFESRIEKAVKLLTNSSSPGIYVGWGAMDAIGEVKQLAEKLAIPVSTSLQGISVFPYNHPLHTGVSFGNYAVPAAKNAFAACDCLLAVGVRFSEISTFSYQLPVPSNLIHIDINPDVFYKNYQPAVAIKGDSKDVLSRILAGLTNRQTDVKERYNALTKNIAKDKEDYKKSWLSNPSEQAVSPGFFFNALRNHFPKDTILITDTGTHRFHAAELFPVLGARQFICPGDSNIMGYAIPACIGAKFLNRSNMVTAVVSESELVVNGLEMVTAQYYKLGIPVFVIRDSLNEQDETSREKLPLIKTPIYKSIDIEKFSGSIHADYFLIKNDIEISGVLTKTLDAVKFGKNVIVEVNWDNSRLPAFSSGVGSKASGRISLADKIRMLFKSGN
jgi:acetolactate synthase I/II/III large subunit